VIPRRLSLAGSLLALAGCQDQRITALERDIRDLSLSVDDLDADRRLLDQAWHRAAADGTLKYNRDPDDWDPSKPLPAGDPTHPDVILLSIDTLRADHLGSYGYSFDTSPYLDSLAAKGTRFASTWAPAPWTLPSHTTMLTGLLPIHHGTIEDNLPVSPDVHLIQSAFHDAGYLTAGVTSTLFVSKKFGFDRGFDFFYDFGISDPHINNLSTVNAENVFAEATDWVQKQPAGKPMFLFLHVYDVHYSYNAPAPWNEKFDRANEPDRDAKYREYNFYLEKPLPAAQMAHQVASYDEEIAYVDDEVRGFLERWQASGRKVYFAVTGDHGEEFDERGSWGHGHTLYPEQLHVPWIVVGPGVKTQVVSQRVGTEDIAPTLAGLAGVEFAPEDGVNRATELRAGPRSDGAHVAAEYADTSRKDENRIRWHSDPYDVFVDLKTGKTEVCDVVKDPRCETLFSDPAIAARAEKGLEAFLGDPWLASADGTVKVLRGAVYSGKGAPMHELAVHAGTRFTVLPGDATVTFVAADGTESGPFQPLGGAVPAAGDPLRFNGTAIGTGIELSASEAEMLKLIGYTQPDMSDGGGAKSEKAGKSGKSGKAKAKATPADGADGADGEGEEAPGG
jgi:arylsulfatase A-like enzyme